MPYVTPEARTRLDAGERPSEAGELNYAVTRLVDAYLAHLAGQEGRTRYAHVNEAIGVLECAKLELYRRIASPYEDDKIAENGDVYTTRGR